MADNDRKERRKHLYYLHELSDFKVDSDDPDVRGWPVKDADNRVIGKVDNFLVSKEKKRVVYLDVEVDKTIIEANHDPYGKPASGDVHEFINKDGENHLILPVGFARLNEDEKFVYTDKIDHQTFAETKRMEKGYDVDREYEVVVLESYNRDEDSRLRKKTDVDMNDRANRVDKQPSVVTDGDRDRNEKIGTGDTDSNVTGKDRGTDIASRNRDTKETRERNNDLNEERRRMKEGDRNNDFEGQGKIAGRSGTLADNDRRTVDRDRDALTGDEKGKASDRRGSGTIPEDDSFYDRGEFDYSKYRR